MKLIVGLGNPGPEYAKTRHNAGFVVLDRLADTHAKGVGGGAIPKSRFQAMTVEADIGSEKCVFMKPMTFMNLSGRAVSEAIRFFKLQPATDLLVVVDDFYLPVGSIRIREAGGTGGHNGLSSIDQALGNGLYPRVRVGVGERPSGGKPANWDQADYVLSKFADDEWSDMQPAFDRAAKASETFVRRGLAAAMNEFNGNAEAHRARQAGKVGPDGAKPAPGAASNQNPSPASSQASSQKVE
ncbi:MAG: aminoacyl-tRNA hydrolase [Phycisphaeraceae bacterium]|nr:aminoacyl-tRNA hydrolase [Phycisphaeraceae bacterium]